MHRSPKDVWAASASSGRSTRIGKNISSTRSFRYWRRHGVRTSVRSTDTARRIDVSSRIIGAWWTETLGLGRTSYEQRHPRHPLGAVHRTQARAPVRDVGGRRLMVPRQPGAQRHSRVGNHQRRAGRGHGAPPGELGIVCSWRRGRTAKSTKETHWLRISGAGQIEGALFLVPERHRGGVLTASGRQKKRIAPTGYRRFGDGIPWARVVDARSWRPSRSRLLARGSRQPHGGDVRWTHLFHNCFPKDVSALKQLAGNTGYHFQLLTAVIEVNELQKRRVIGKLEKHLGSLVGKNIALLGLAFKPDTDDMREASSLVLAARLAGRGGDGVRGYDPVAERAGAGAAADRRVLRLGRAGARRRRRGDPGHRVARVRRARLGRACASGWRTRC